MRILTAPLRELGEYEEIEKSIQEEGIVALTGCIDSQKFHVAGTLGEKMRYKLIITYSEQRTREIYEDFKLYDRNVTIFPARDLIFYEADIHSNELTIQRMKVLRRLLEGRPCTIVTTFDTLMMPIIPVGTIAEHVLSVDKRSTIDEHEFAKTLITMGYEKNYQVEAPGQFSIRGGIIDVFDLTEENPYRIELWGDEIESIRSFDLLSQRSIESLESISIYPASEMILTEDQLREGFARIRKEAKKHGEVLRKEFRTEEAHRIETSVRELEEQAVELRASVNLDSYLAYFYPSTDVFLTLFDPKKTGIFIEEPTRVEEHASAIEAEFRDSMSHRLEKGYILPGQTSLLLEKEKVAACLQKYHTVTLSALDFRTGIFKPRAKFDIPAVGVASYNQSFELLVKDLKRYCKEGYRVLVLSGSRTRAKRLAGDLLDQDLTAFYTENPDRELQPGEVALFYGRVLKGFSYPMLKFVVITESDIFGAEKKKKKKKRQYEGQKIQDFNDLKVGDYVVHENHGLGIYKGIEKVESDHVVKDYLKIEYGDGGNLYIPATGLDVIQKYASADAKKPKLNKLGTQEWARTKSKVREAVGVVAQDLVELYALRNQEKGFSFGADTVWQREFEESFPFEETEDQLNAIADTKKDMESTKIMDRLICGDVGYGKTEIAIRAAFKAIQDGKQVAFLVPTTILAQQHYNTFTQRMKDFPVRVEMLSRFRTAAEQKKTLERLSQGKADIVIGTHRLLSKDVTFKDLGLLVIDEEQRFGVTHKEKIKKMRENVDVLTLTATPIPRTLHMSLIGIRDMSVLEEAPNERVPIQTFVCEYNEEMVREAITRELSRGGQIYYVYNKVNNIADVASQIQKLVPEANVAFAHGQMKESELEKIMVDFISGDIDVLVTTTIIETGLDISNVNTMIIHDSDAMGLSQLYQLRGRVGRSNRTAYAFLMYRKNKMLKEVAEKRLTAIREFTELGSGFKIAMRDLEIRGAGNLLGKEQHGHMAAVGYDLYCKMLDEAVKTLKGVDIREDFVTSVDLDVDAFIPPSYIANEVQKLDIYKRIADIESDSECEDVREELLDRFGEIPSSVQNLMRISRMRGRAHRLYITELRAKNEEISILLKPDAGLKPEGIPSLLARQKGQLSFQSKGTPAFYGKYEKAELREKTEENIMHAVEELLQSMEEELL
ncbi:MAG: transcription-repair coupling factor [Lachnospiraceae bacterium]|nr:transcription-repair coupling factor [Lachnospiraceae bacterium]